MWQVSISPDKVRFPSREGSQMDVTNSLAKFTTRMRWVRNPVTSIISWFKKSSVSGLSEKTALV